MVSETKTKPKSNYYLRIFLIFLSVCLVSYYFWNKICHILFHQKAQDWWYLDMIWTKSTDGSLYTALSQTQFYRDLLYSIYEDFIGCFALTLQLILQAGNCISFNAYIFIFISFVISVISCIIFYIYSHKDQHAENEKRRKNNVRESRNKEKSSLQESSVSCVSSRKKMYRRWVKGLLFFAFLISIPWEFVRLYQSMVAEKVAQMKTGIPPDCVPEEMSFYQRIQSFLRMQMSWSDDPCLVYHKAILVDPMWQVNPLMVITSAFSHCIVYPTEILFSGLGKSFRLFFSEIPAQWQPFMLIVIVLFMTLALIMTFGYKIHLPFVLKLEPNSPRYVRIKPRNHSAKPDMNNLDDSVMSTQDSFEAGSLDTQYSLDSQSY